MQDDPSRVLIVRGDAIPHSVFGNCQDLKDIRKLDSGAFLLSFYDDRHARHAFDTLPTFLPRTGVAIEHVPLAKVPRLVPEGDPILDGLDPRVMVYAHDSNADPSHVREYLTRFGPLRSFTSVPGQLPSFLAEFHDTRSAACAIANSNVLGLSVSAPIPFPQSPPLPQETNSSPFHSTKPLPSNSTRRISTGSLGQPTPSVQLRQSPSEQELRARFAALDLDSLDHKKHTSQAQGTSSSDQDQQQQQPEPEPAPLYPPAYPPLYYPYYPPYYYHPYPVPPPEPPRAPHVRSQSHPFPTAQRTSVSQSQTHTRSQTHPSYALNPTRLPASARSAVTLTRDPPPERNQIDLNRIAQGKDTRTTVMIKNIPNKLTDRDLLEFISSVCPRRIDFLYLRMDFKNGCNVGYAFVNFIQVRDLLQFARAKLGVKWNMFSSEKVLQMSYANYQGKEALVEKFKNSCVMDEQEAWRPKIFYSNGPKQGMPEPFPPPTHLRRKERSAANRGALYVPGSNGPSGEDMRIPPQTY